MNRWWGIFSVALNLSLKLSWLHRIRREFPVQPFPLHLTGYYLDSKETSIIIGLVKTGKGTFTLCPFQYQSPCQSPCPCPMKNQFIRKSEVLFRLHQFPYPYPNQCHPIPVNSVSIGPPTVKNWYGRPILSVSGPETCAAAMHCGILVYFSSERTPSI